MIERARFKLENPQNVGIGIVANLTIDASMVDFVSNLPYVSNVEDFTISFKDRYRVWFDSRYDYEEAWLDLYGQLDIETQPIELEDVWNIGDES